MPNEVLIIVIIIGAVGASLVFIGWLFTFLTALGNKQYVFGAFACFIPPVAHIYCALHWARASHGGKMLYGGTVLMMICLGIVALYDFQLFPKQLPIPERPTPLLPTEPTNP